jgi:hypothetical protein
MKLIGAALGIAICAATVAAQEIKTTTKEKTKFEVKDGKDMKVTGCVQPFEDAGYMLTNDAGELKYVLVTKENLTKYVGQRVEVKGLGADHDGGKIKIEKEVGTTGHIGDAKIDTGKTKRTTEIEGDVGFAYVSVESIKRIAKDCR